MANADHEIEYMIKNTSRQYTYIFKNDKNYSNFSEILFLHMKK
jgi:hypothetical protein